ncbi:hypothetical protein OE88DRAFT_1391539 [Heliocybe sulcata]|uniref:Secreted protein n=1 Tax=Heliocybe sulcata TaxID=5364 RepID=A0A5C3N5B1_9AGAM|nr:hypothetical protein OE88DRAFT_1391539 [Heliocybe sulcata]
MSQGCILVLYIFCLNSDCQLLLGDQDLDRRTQDLDRRCCQRRCSTRSRTALAKITSGTLYTTARMVMPIANACVSNTVLKRIPVRTATAIVELPANAAGYFQRTPFIECSSLHRHPLHQGRILHGVSSYNWQAVPLELRMNSMKRGQWTCAEHGGGIRSSL